MQVNLYKNSILEASMMKKYLAQDTLIGFSLINFRLKTT